MKILLVNDDGYQSKALEALRKELLKYGEVFVVAPKIVMSGKSVALTIADPFEVVKKNEHLYIVDGSPADCVSFALSYLDIKFDLTVAGINYGHNITYDVMHSGTCGACIESLFYGVPSIAFSAEKNVEESAKLVDQVMDYIFSKNLLSLDYILNVNFPTDISNVKGIKFTILDFRKDKRYYVFENDDEIVTPKRDIGEGSFHELSDLRAVKEGYISITPLMKTYFSIDLYERIKKEKKLD